MVLLAMTILLCGWSSFRDACGLAGYEIFDCERADATG
jgi:hypothetical protein